MEDTREK